MDAGHQVSGHAGQRLEGVGVLAGLDGLHHGELHGAGVHVAAGELTGQLHHGVDETAVGVENVVQGVIDDLDEADEQHQLDEGGDEVGKGIVLLPLVQLLRLLGDAVFVPEVVGLDPVQFRGQVDDLDAVVLHPDGHRQQDHLGQQGEEQDGQGVIAQDIVTEVHDVAQDGAQAVHNRAHKCLLLFLCGDDKVGDADGAGALAGILVVLTLGDSGEGDVQGQGVVLEGADRNGEL